MHVSVLGCGRWGSFLAWYAAHVGHEAYVWGRAESTVARELAETRRNAYLALPEAVTLTHELATALGTAEIVLIAVGAQGLRALCRQLAGHDLHGKTVVLCMKGLEMPAGLRLTQVFREEIAQPVVPAIWVGPGHVQDFVRGVPNCMVIDSDDPATTARVADAFTGPLIRFYYGTDLLGNEVGAAAKNVIGLAAGMLDGLGLTSLKGALMARGTHEIAQLICAMGGHALSAYGLAHLGDYEATLFSPHSHNRRFGEAFVRGEPCEVLAEGVPTAAALHALAQHYQVELPVCTAVHASLTHARHPQEALDELFLRPRKREFLVG